jgi:hypothetical protein
MSAAAVTSQAISSGVSGTCGVMARVGTMPVGASTKGGRLLERGSSAGTRSSSTSSSVFVGGTARAGLPTTTSKSPTSLVTTAPAPTKAAGPTTTPPVVTDPGPNDNANPISLSWPIDTDPLRFTWQPMVVFEVTTTPAFTYAPWPPVAVLATTAVGSTKVHRLVQPGRPGEVRAPGAVPAPRRGRARTVRRAARW